MTKSQWEDLSGKQRWDTLVALRGPDCQHSENIKWFSTGVLRWSLHTVIRVGGTLNQTFKHILVPSEINLTERLIRATSSLSTLAWSPTHFFQHLREAADVCGINVYDIPSDVYWEAMAEGDVARATARLGLWAEQFARTSAYRTLAEDLTQHCVLMWGRVPAKILPPKSTTTQDDSYAPS